MKNIKIFSTLLSLLLLTSLFELLAFDPDYIPAPNERLASFSIQAVPKVVRGGESFRISAQIDIPKGWHIYSVQPQGDDAPPPTTMELLNSNFIKDGPVYETRPIFDFDKVIGLKLSYHKNRAFLYQNLTVPTAFPAGEKAVTVKITYLICSERICLPPRNFSQNLKINIEAGEPRAEFLIADRSIADPLSNDLFQLLSGGIWQFIGLAALMGLASLITPCVFPMIPITVSWFSKQAEGKKSTLIRQAIIFALGIIASYTTVGVLFSAIFGAGSVLSLASNPLINLAIAIMFILFAFSLMGAFEITLPVGLQQYMDQKARSIGGTVGVLLMGVTFTLTAFTCTVQFVGTMLIAAAQGEWIWPVLGMLVFSTVFAFPFFLLALLPGLIQSAQRSSGKWLGRSKVVLGVLELMASIKFLSNADLVWETNLISRNTAIIIWLALVATILAYLLWTAIRERLKLSFQWLTIALFAGIFGWLWQGYGGNSLGSLIDAVLPPTEQIYFSGENFVSEEEREKLVWLKTLDEALELAKSQNKAIFIDFTGYTCVNCRWMEQNIFALKIIHERFSSDFILVRLYTDGGERAKENLKLQIERFNTVALPFYAILSKNGQIIRSFSGISRDPADFESFLTLKE